MPSARSFAMCFLLVASGCASDLGGASAGNDADLDASAAQRGGADAGRSDAATGAGGNADAGGAMASPAEGPTESFAALYRDILMPKCAGPYCHVATNRGGLNLTSPSIAYQRLVGRKGGADERDPYSLCKDGGTLRVAPGDPENSLLIQKLTRGDQDVCGKPMPLDLAPLPEADIARLRRWIAQGAPDN